MRLSGRRFGSKRRNTIPGAVRALDDVEAGTTLPRASPSYLCLTRACAVAELRQQGVLQGGIGVAGLLPRVLYRYDVVLEEVMDLTDPPTLAAIGVAPADLLLRDRDLPQHIRELVHDLGRQAILAPPPREWITSSSFSRSTSALGRSSPKRLSDGRR